MERFKDWVIDAIAFIMANVKFLELIVGNFHICAVID
ncbi:hypothetical protein NIES2098_18010 [Calothrix sp. NIES-2098]|nr:hypothetical protein NIES2098_18010 [Calothrix sp. NIES-2098]